MIKKKIKNILVVLGGSSGERAVSLETGRACIIALKRKGYKVFTFDPKFNNFNLINTKKIDAIFNALHGKDGEDGVAQSYFEYLKVPYTHSGVISSYNAMNKLISKKIFLKNKIKTPNHHSIKKKNYKISSLKKNLKKKKIKLPIIVKPIDEGSSLGVELCKTKKDLIKSLKKLFKKYQDYKAKYTKAAKTKHIMPARLKNYQYKKVLQLAKKAHNILKCRGVTRADFKFEKNNFYLLEINTQPGMTSLSLVPEIANYRGITFENLVEKILLDASINK